MRRLLLITLLCLGLLSACVQFKSKRAVEVVDVNDLLRPMPQHDWGGALLEALPTTLNSDSRMDTGQNGIEQRGTTRRVGQHTLELRQDIHDTTRP